MALSTVHHADGPGLQWLYGRIEELGFASLSSFAKQVGVNKGNLYRYFAHESKPAVTVLPLLCTNLKASPEEVLGALGVDLLGFHSELTAAPAGDMVSAY